MTRPARARVLGRFDLASQLQEATVTIDRAVGLFSVRPLRRPCPNSAAPAAKDSKCLVPWRFFAFLWVLWPLPS